MVDNSKKIPRSGFFIFIGWLFIAVGLFVFLVHKVDFKSFDLGGDNQTSEQDEKLRKEEFNKRLNDSMSLISTNEGIKYIEKRDYKKAIEWLTSALEKNPNNASAMYKKGYAYLMLGKKQDAMDMYRKVVALPGDDVITLNNKGAAYYGLGNREMSFQTYNLAIEKYPNDAIAYYDKGAIFSLEKNFGESIDNLKKSIELDASQKEKAKIDHDYNNVRYLPEFKKLIY